MRYNVYNMQSAVVLSVYAEYPYIIVHVFLKFGYNTNRIKTERLHNEEIHQRLSTHL